MKVKPIGVLQMLDQGERDDKIIAVHCHDPAFRGFNDISELPAHRLAEIRSFFEDYKKNENKVGPQAADVHVPGREAACFCLSAWSAVSFMVIKAVSRSCHKLCLSDVAKWVLRSEPAKDACNQLN